MFTLQLKQVATVLVIAAIVSTFVVFYQQTPVSINITDIVSAMFVALLAVVVGTYPFKSRQYKEVFVTTAMASTLIIAAVSFHYYFITNESTIAAGFFAMAIVPIAVYLGI